MKKQTITSSIILVLIILSCSKIKGGGAMELNKLKEPLAVTGSYIPESRFSDSNMKGSSFKGINLSGASFHDVSFVGASIAAANLGGAKFKHIGPPPDAKTGKQEKQAPVTFEEMTLSGSTFDKVDLSGVTIRDCNLEGMTINGILVTELLAAYNSKGDGDDVLHRKH
jgi:uncharacterized protein YjbI with pentapeptide repeats